MAKRISITLSPTQETYIALLASRQGLCPTAFVMQLVVQTIGSALEQGVIGDRVIEPQSAKFIRSLVSESGVELANINAVCTQLGIPQDQMYHTLGISSVLEGLQEDSPDGTQDIV